MKIPLPIQLPPIRHDERDLIPVRAWQLIAFALTIPALVWAGFKLSMMISN